MVWTSGASGTHLWLDHALPDLHHPHLQQPDHPGPEQVGHNDDNDDDDDNNDDNVDSIFIAGQQ